MTELKKQAVETLGDVPGEKVIYGGFGGARVYLDNCCFNRPFGDQSNIVVMMETEAKLYVQDLILLGELKLVWSFILDYENNNNPFEERKSRISEWKKMAIYDCVLCDQVAEDAKKLMGLGLRQKDASHIACAIYGNADYFLTTDKKILNKRVTGVKLLNPIEFIRGVLDEE